MKVLMKESCTRRIRFSASVKKAHLIEIAMVARPLAVVLPGNDDDEMLRSVFIQTTRDFHRKEVTLVNVFDSSVKRVPMDQLCYPVTLDIKAMF